MTVSTLRNAMTVDVEDYFHVSALSKVIARADWDRMEYRAEASTHRLLDLFDECGTRATFFILGWIARRSPALVRTIHARGHEIGCHGLSHELIYRQTPQQFTHETRDSKAFLEDLTGVRISGYRAASWSITRKSLWALDVLHGLGFEYDSSIFPIRHDIYGIPDAQTCPGFVTTPAGHRIVEFPPSTVSMFGVQLPVSGGGYFRLLPYWLTRRGLRRINRDLHHAFIFYLHPWEIDPDQPRVNASRLSRFRHYTNLQKTYGRLQKLLQEFHCATARNVLADLGLLPPP